MIVYKRVFCCDLYIQISWYLNDKGMDGESGIRYVSGDILFLWFKKRKGVRGRIVEGNRKEIIQKRGNVKEVNCKNLLEVRKGVVYVCISLRVN